MILRDARAARRGRLRQRLLLQIFAATGNAGGGHAGPASRSGEIRAALPVAGRDRPPPGGLQCAMPSAAPSTCCSRSRVVMLARSSGAPHISSRSLVMAPTSMIGEIAAVTVTEVERQQPVRGAGGGARRSRRARGDVARGTDTGGGLRPLRSSRSDNGSLVSRASPREMRRRKSCSPSTTIGWRRCCSANTGKISR